MAVPIDRKQSRSAYGIPFLVRQLAPLLALALLIKAGFMFAVLPAIEGHILKGYGITFADDYDKLARNLLQGNGYRLTPETGPTMMREPGYPFLLAGAFIVFGDGIEAARTANLLLGGAAAILITVLALRVSGDRTAALIAPLIFLFHPATLIADARGGFEILFILLLTIFLLALGHAIERGRYRDFAWAGASFGAVLLTRGTPLLFPLLVLGYLLWRARSSLGEIRVLTRMMVFGVVALVVLSPWLARNYMISGTITPTASVQGTALQTGQFLCENMALDRTFQLVDDQAGRERDALAHAWHLPFTGWYYQYFYWTADEVSFNRALAERAWQRYASDPAFWAGCMARNLFNFWFMGKNWKVTWVNLALQLPFLVLFALGVWRLWRAERWGSTATLIVLFAIYLYGVHVPIHAQARYSVPLIPFLSIFVSIAITGFWRDWRRGRLEAVSKQSRLGITGWKR